MAPKNVIILHGFLGMGDNWRGFAKKFDSGNFLFSSNRSKKSW